ncbi:MAG: HU family DNA-binding protein [Candidatus Eisenbacteria bacterium]
MNKSQLVKYVSYKTKLPRKDVWMAVDTTLDCIKRYTHRRGGVKIPGFGNFQCISQKPQRKWNSRTKRYQYSKPYKEVMFTPTRTWWNYSQS